MDDQQMKELVHSMRPMPCVVLPDFWFGPKVVTKKTTPEAWRKVFEVERDSARDKLDRLNFQCLIQIVNIAEECGATNLVFGMKAEELNSGCYTKLVYLEDIWFPKKSIDMLSRFRYRLGEVV